MKRGLSTGDLSTSTHVDADSDLQNLTQANTGPKKAKKNTRAQAKSSKAVDCPLSNNGDTQMATSQNGDRYPFGSCLEASSDHRKVIINELLFFVFNKYDNHSKAAIQSVVSNFFREDEIATAKQVILQYVPTSLVSAVQQYVRNRIGDGKVDRAVADILNIVGIIDENGARDSLPIFCALMLSRIPTMPDDMADLAAIRHELSDLRRQFNNMLHTVTLSRTDHQLLPSAEHAHNQSVDVGEPQTATVSKQQPVSQAAASDGSVDDVNHIQPDFSAVVKANCDRYEQVAGKKKNKKKVVVGNSAQENKFKGVVKKAVLCVNRLELGTSVEDIKTHLCANDVNVISCFELKPPDGRERHFTTMRLCVSVTDLKKIYDASMWPLGVVVRPWTFKPNQTKPNTHLDNQPHNLPSDSLPSC